MTYHPNWKAIIDKKEVKPIILSPFFMGIPLSKGLHTVLFYYSPPLTRTILLLLSFIVLLLIIIFKPTHNLIIKNNKNLLNSN